MKTIELITNEYYRFNDVAYFSCDDETSKTRKVVKYRGCFGEGETTYSFERSNGYGFTLTEEEVNKYITPRK